MALTKIGKEGITGIDNSSDATAIIISSGEVVTLADDLIIKDSGTIGSASKTDAITIASSGLVQLTSTGIGAGSQVFQVIDDGATLFQIRAEDGNVSFPQAGAGIYLGVTSGNAANLLDDYEEGNWTPSIGGNASYSIQTGKYIKVGNLVHCTATIQVNSIGTGSVNTLSGLPFTSSNHGITAGAVNVMYYTNLSQGFIWLSGYVRNNNTSIYFSGNTVSSTTIQHNSQSLFQNSARVDFNATYSSG